MATRGSDTWRRQFWGEPCQSASTRTKVTIGRASLPVDRRIVEACKALDTALRVHGYDVHPAYPEGDTGSYNCRHQRNDPNAPYSSHAWATAIDVNWNSNPAGSRFRTDMPRAMTDQIQAIKTNTGSPVWRWGGDWDNRPDTPHSYYDAMHFEIHSTPTELSTGINWSTVPGGDPMKKYVYGKRGTPDRNGAQLVADYFPDPELGIATHPDGARAAAKAGSTVFVVGGPACRELGFSDERGIIKRDNNFVTVWGQTGGDTLDLIEEVARKGWSA